MLPCLWHPYSLTYLILVFYLSIYGKHPHTTTSCMTHEEVERRGQLHFRKCSSSHRCIIQHILSVSDGLRMNVYISCNSLYKEILNLVLPAWCSRILSDIICRSPLRMFLLCIPFLWRVFENKCHITKSNHLLLGKYENIQVDNTNHSSFFKEPIVFDKNIYCLRSFE